MTIPEVDATQLEALGPDVVLIDVREPDEWQQGHVPHARLIPLAQVPGRISEVPVDLPVYVICQSGGRSHQAAEFLSSHGVDARNVAGGTLAWQALGHPVETGS